MFVTLVSAAFVLLDEAALAVEAEHYGVAVVADREEMVARLQGALAVRQAARHGGVVLAA